MISQKKRKLEVDEGEVDLPAKRKKIETEDSSQHQPFSDSRIGMDCTLFSLFCRQENVATSQEVTGPQAMERSDPTKRNSSTDANDDFTMTSGVLKRYITDFTVREIPNNSNNDHAKKSEEKEKRTEETSMSGSCGNPAPAPLVLKSLEVPENCREPPSVSSMMPISTLKSTDTMGLSAIQERLSNSTDSPLCNEEVTKIMAFVRQVLQEREEKENAKMEIKEARKRRYLLKRKHLSEPWFTHVMKGRKVYEGRLAREDWLDITVGSRFIFFNDDVDEEHDKQNDASSPTLTTAKKKKEIEVEVLGITKCSNFTEAWHSFGAQLLPSKINHETLKDSVTGCCAGEKEELTAAEDAARIYAQFYSQEDIQKYGVLIFHFKMIPPFFSSFGSGVDAKNEEQEATNADTTSINKSSGTRSVVFNRRDSKEERTKIHNLVKTCLAPVFTTGTNAESNCIELLLVKGGGSTAAVSRFHRENDPRGGGGNNPRKEWPKSRQGCEHLHLTVYKENIDSSTMLRQLGSKIGISAKQIQFCGTKDKRGVTLQRVSCRWLSAERISRVNGMSFGRNGIVKVGDFCYEKQGLTMGRDLLGNHFTIVLREFDLRHHEKNENQEEKMKALQSIVQKIEKHLRSVGFANYFGPQRFGTTNILTSDVGCALIKGDYRTAVMLIFKSKAELNPSFWEVVELVEIHENYEEALQKTPHYFYSERDMLQVLKRDPRNFEGALAAIPRPLGMLYCHSVQSLVWNKLVSLRLTYHQDHPPRPEVGDLVLFKTKQRNDAQFKKQKPNNRASLDCSEEKREQGEQEEEEDNDKRALEDVELEGMAEEGGVQDDSVMGAKGTTLPKVHLLTQEDLDTKLYWLADIILPVPGPDRELVFPTHPSCNLQQYRKQMKEYGALALLGGEHLSPQQPEVQKEESRSGGNTKANSKNNNVVVDANDNNKTLFEEEKRIALHLMKRYHFHGTYRKMVQIPFDFHIELKRYSKQNEEIVQTDWQKLQQKRDHQAGGANTLEENKIQNDETEEKKSPQQTKGFIAAVVRFGLGTGSYATSALREFCRTKKWCAGEGNCTSSIRQHIYGDEDDDHEE